MLFLLYSAIVLSFEPMVCVHCYRLTMLGTTEKVESNYPPTKAILEAAGIYFVIKTT